jgi:hypothetical protein
VYNGDRSVAARISAWVRSLVAVMWHGNWRGWSDSRPRYDMTGSGRSLGCGVITE